MFSEVVEKIINSSLNAPSGDNSQPWKFKLNGNELSIFNIPERDLTLYNHKQLGSYVAHGALIENIVISASHYGLGVKTELFPDPSNEKFISRLTFSGQNLSEDVLFTSIKDRTTNRKKYEDKPLLNSQKEELDHLAKNWGEFRLVFVEDKGKREGLATALSVNEKILLSNRELHKVFFSHVRWNSHDEKKYKTGLYAKTLELIPPQLAVFKLCSVWPILSVLRKISLPAFIAKENAKVYASGAAFGAVLLPSGEKKQYVKAGRFIERIWLSATKFGLSFQPVTAIPYLALRAKEGVSNEFTEEHLKMIEAANEDINSILGLKGESVAMIFRIGYSEKPSARSSKLPADILFK